MQFLKAECRHLLGFVQSLVDKHCAELEVAGWKGNELVKAVGHLEKMYTMLEAFPHAMDKAQSRALSRAARKCLKSAQKAEVHMIPKCHMALHCASQRCAGNPAFFSTYTDESFNRDVKRIVQSLHKADFSMRLLSKIWLLESLQS